MMNRHGSFESYVPSIMSFAGLEASTQKQQQSSSIWDYETTNTQQNQPYFSNSQFLDYTPQLLLPTTNMPFYSPALPQAIPNYQEEELIAVGGRIGLNLGRRTYFSSGDALALGRLWGRSRGGYAFGHHPPPRCQADGCGADLSGSKHYHRRHKVCEFHSKAAVVLFAGGVQQRFCQQCSRFHVLSEFDETKRSCRKRLADHNRRRRKPKPHQTSSSATSPTHKTKPSPKPVKDLSASSKKEVLQFKNDPALSLGRVDRVNNYNNGGMLGISDVKDVSQQELFSNDFFSNQSLLCSTSNEDSGSRDAGQSSLLQLGQAMFSMDFI